VRIRDPMAGGDPTVLATHSERYRKKAVDWLDMEIGGRSLMTAGSGSMDGGRRTIWLEAGGLLWLEARQEDYCGWGSIAGFQYSNREVGDQRWFPKLGWSSYYGGARSLWSNPRVGGDRGWFRVYTKGYCYSYYRHQFIQQRQQARVRQRFQRLFRLGSRRMKLGLRRRRRRCAGRVYEVGRRERSHTRLRRA